MWGEAVSFWGGYLALLILRPFFAKAPKETLGQERGLGDAYDKDYQNEKALQWVHRRHILGICKEE